MTLMTMNFRLTAHCSEDRTDRLTFIMMSTGFGETFCEYQKDEWTLYRLTTTGVLMVIDPTWNGLITAYYVNKKKACAIMKLSQNPHLNANRMYKTIKANEKFYIEQNKITY